MFIRRTQLTLFLFLNTEEFSSTTKFVSLLARHENLLSSLAICFLFAAGVANLLDENTYARVFGEICLFREILS